MIHRSVFYSRVGNESLYPSHVARIIYESSTQSMLLDQTMFWAAANPALNFLFTPLWPILASISCSPCFTFYMSLSRLSPYISIYTYIYIYFSLLHSYGYFNPFATHTTRIKEKKELTIYVHRKSHIDIQLYPTSGWFSLSCSE